MCRGRPWPYGHLLEALSRAGVSPGAEPPHLGAEYTGLKVGPPGSGYHGWKRRAPSHAYGSSLWYPLPWRLLPSLTLTWRKAKPIVSPPVREKVSRQVSHVLQPSLTLGERLAFFSLPVEGLPKEEKVGTRGRVRTCEGEPSARTYLPAFGCDRWSRR